MKRSVITGCLSIVLFLSLIVVIPAFTASAQDVPVRTPVAAGPVEQINEYFSTQTTTYSDGAMLDLNVISGPPVPPPGYELERTAVQLPEPYPEMGTSTLTVPAFKWVFGCSAVSASMIAGYYDRSGFPNMYTGPANGGLMPLVEDASWGTWVDSNLAIYPNNPLIASHNGLDGRTTRGSIDDYWIEYGSAASDPYVTGGWAQHAWGHAIGDYMKTSQSAYANTDGSTNFYNWTTKATPLTCADMEGYSIDSVDGTYGRKLFYEDRGYTVTVCYSQRTDNTIAKGFSFAQYKAEIDAGRPVFLNLAGHSIVGVGYDASSKTVYLHDTWDHSNHTMLWGTSYSGLGLLSVSIVNPTGHMPAITAVTPAVGTIGTAVTITGNFFGATQGPSTVRFSGALATVSTWSNTIIKCTVPAGATTGSVVVTTPVGSSAGKTFTVKPPVVASLAPAAGTIGTAVTITGNFFGPTKGASSVTFSGVPASVSTWSNTIIKCTVPVGATTGSVVVWTPAGSSAGKMFTVKPPVVASLAPAAGIIGAAVTITGNFFGPTPGASSVTFSGVPASVSTWSNTIIKCHVPVGAGTGPVVVWTLAGSSAGKIFTVKP